MHNSRNVRRRVAMTLHAFVLVAFGPGVLSAQPSEHSLPQYRKLNLPEVLGPVPLIHSPGAEERALKYQKELAAAVAWFNQQLDTEIEIALAVVDQSAWEKVSSPPYPIPYMNSAREPFPALAVVPARIEDYPGFDVFFSGQDPNAVAEVSSLHEAGHAFADALAMRNKSQLVDELLATVFAAAIVNRRPEYAFWKAGPPAAVPRPRYTSITDFDYLYGQFELLNFRNVAWLAMHFYRLAAFLVEDQEFSVLIGKLKAAFPPAEPRVSVREAFARLEKLKPGFAAAAGELTGPTTLAKVDAIECVETTPGSAPSFLVVQNDTGQPLSVRTASGDEGRIRPGQFAGVRGKTGEQLMLPQNRCLVFGPEPGLAIVQSSL